MNTRQPHAALDIMSRKQKAKKIELLLGLDNECGPLRLLEVGCGSGGICHYFGTHFSGRYEVHAVDVKDSRTIFDGFSFKVIKDTLLPYPDAIFDVVISNHVIEHVGDATAQLQHLQEIRRVLKPGGIGYLAVPNRWMLVEPHYKLAFLSWLPVGWRSPYLRLFRDAEYYDCRPLELRETEILLDNAGFIFQNRCVQGIRAVLEIEGAKNIFRKLIAILPDSLLSWMNSVNPTLIYVFKSNQMVGCQKGVNSL